MKDFLIHLAKYRLFLASRSPRRQRLLTEMGLPFQVWLKEETDEQYPAGMDPLDVALYLARQKAQPYLPELSEGDVLITADTLVVLDGAILGKPTDREDAIRILSGLSGNPHEVITGVGLWSKSAERLFEARTKVWFDNLSIKEIEEYVDTCKPFDKAGAYGIQEWIGFVGIERIEGSFYNVMGLPIHRLYRELQKFTKFRS
ncbi:MAG: Maf family nucleotide pyrophosphatase [Bacteroidales bacterium]